MASRYIKKYILDFLDEMKEANQVWGRPRRLTPSVKFEKLIADLDFRNDLNRNRKRKLADFGDSDIVNLFKLAGLDHRDPSSWFALIGFISDVLLHDKPLAGRPPKWDRPSKTVYKRDFVSCLRDNPRHGGKTLAYDMKQKFPKRYGRIPEQTLERWRSENGISIKAEKGKMIAALKIRRN